MIWRSVVVAAYVACALVFSFVFGGGTAVLASFAVRGLVWLVFSLFWAWADGVRRGLLRPPSSS